MDKEQTNKFLTLLMKNCWHEWKISEYIKSDIICDFYQQGLSKLYKYECKLCKIDSNEKCNKDFSTSADFLEYMRWVGEQEWFGNMIDYIQDIAVEENFYGFNLKLYTDIAWSIEDQIKWYKENKDRWGYEECPSAELCFDTYDENLIPPHKFCREELDCKGMTKTKALRWLEECEG